MRPVSYVVKRGDAREWLVKLKPESISALVCDPPAGISFMGKEWDAAHANWRAPDPTVRGAGWNPGAETGRTPRSTPRCRLCGKQKWSGNPCACPAPVWDDGAREARTVFVEGLGPIFTLCLRAMKPGAHGLVWALPRTSHWTATALEDAGFEIRDVITHHFGTGFPKSLDVSKAVAKAGEIAPFSGWGTALKPASEHWILVRKPLIGAVAANVLAHGTGGLNIDATRIDASGGRPARIADLGPDGGASSYDVGSGRAVGETTTGRWPANLVLSHAEGCGDICAPGCPVALLDSQSGVLKGNAGAVKRKPDQDGAAYGADQRPPGTQMIGYADVGGASRFFYVAKPGRKERDAGCHDLPPRTGGEATDREDGSAGLSSPRAGAGRTGGVRNHHPTVKSVALMEWLVKLVTPPGGVVLDPFLGSGSTGVACVNLGFDFIGIEREDEYAEIAERRIAHAVQEATK